jgi:hypothetical protein
MIVILAGTKVRFPNSDQVRHNVFSPKPVDGKKLNFGTYPAGDSKEWTFTKPGPVNLLCNIHFEMSAWIVVVETPYYAMVDLQGNYVIKNVPPGNYSLTAWQGDPKVRSRTQQIQVTDTGAVSANFDLRK